MIPVTSANVELSHAIQTHILTICNRLDITNLPKEEFVFLVETHTNFIDECITKYLEGHIEHHDSPFFSCAFKREDRKEFIDAFYYREGDRYVQSGRLAHIRKLLAGNGDLKGGA